MKWFFLFFSSLALFLGAEEPIRSPQEIEQELQETEILFQKAKEMFNPWYGGPLLTGSAHMMPPGTASAQVYLYMTDFYATWDHNRRTVEIPDKFTLNPALSGVQFGITKWLDGVISLQGDFNWQQSHFHGGFGDLQIGLGLRILEEKLSSPAVKVSVSETFPTGRYTGLSPEGLGLHAIGSGSYQTTFSLRVSKLTFWSSKHPLNLRGTASCTVPTSLNVREFNAYGGGFGTRGKVSPGNSASVNFAFEYSFTQNWVFANDFVYTWSNRTRFSGTPGVLKDGSIASVGSGSSDQLSLCPAIEYNPSPNLNFLAGIWFDVYGRNVSQFISGIVSISYTVSW